ncbi:hypothetical protein KQQSB11_10030 [Klebsiella quasipneumoniae subsp. quasipneumoniae]|nr:hypothetical protein KQQSB11_10030 [Klebsiella quasipneumoniae subsp. quasipneumoniae]
MPINSVRNVFILIPVGFIKCHNFWREIKDTY